MSKPDEHNNTSQVVRARKWRGSQSQKTQIIIIFACHPSRSSNRHWMLLTLFQSMFPRCSATMNNLKFENGRSEAACLSIR
jgi:hypothetical protein